MRSLSPCDLARQIWFVTIVGSGSALYSVLCLLSHLLFIPRRYVCCSAVCIRQIGIVVCTVWSASMTGHRHGTPVDPTTISSVSSRRFIYLLDLANYSIVGRGPANKRSPHRSHFFTLEFGQIYATHYLSFSSTLNSNRRNCSYSRN